MCVSVEGGVKCLWRGKREERKRGREVEGGRRKTTVGGDGGDLMCVGGDVGYGD